jgi:hypothetical protein
LRTSVKSWASASEAISVRSTLGALAGSGEDRLLVGAPCSTVGARSGGGAG